MGSKEPRLSIIVPAFNEESLLTPTLLAIHRSAGLARDSCGIQYEVIVVDNDSTDQTCDLALKGGARVVHEPIHNVGRVRNQGARASTGDILVFVDADTIIPEKLLVRVFVEVVQNCCQGGSFVANVRSKKLIVRTYLDCWRAFGRIFGIAQGATQFCTRPCFDAIGGYNESIFMGEDTDLYVRLRHYAKSIGARSSIVRDLPVESSPRRFDQWPLWKILWLTNPLLILVMRRTRTFWFDWYRNPPR